MAEYSYELKIPKSRLAVLIGKKGEVKTNIESLTKTKITVDSEEGDVVLRGKDALGLYQAKDMIFAIGRGFNPELALLLMKVDYALDMINLNNYAKTKNHMIRIKGRIIGAEGKARKLIEELSETNISVFGKTIAIIGQAENVAIARKAVDSLLKGSPHSSVYHYLEGKRRELKRKDIIGSISKEDK